jgi:hypothetical protein
MLINKSRPIEDLTGDNRGIVRQKLGRIHVMTPIRDQLAECRPRHMRDCPPALRRGWVLCVLETIAEYRGTYIGVTSGRLDYAAKLSR